MTDEVTRINVGFGEIVHSASFFDSSGTITLAAGSVQFFSRIELHRPNGTLEHSVSFEHECLPPPLPWNMVRTGRDSILLAECGENPVLDRMFGSERPSPFGERIMAWARARGMRSIRMGEGAVGRNPAQDANAILSQNADGDVACWTDAEADSGVFRESSMPRHFMEHTGYNSPWPFKMSAGTGEVAVFAQSSLLGANAIGGASGWSLLPRPQGVGLVVPSDYGYYVGPRRLGDSDYQILNRLEKDGEWRAVPMSGAAPPEIAVLGVAGEQIIYYSALEQSVFIADASESRARLSGDHANWLRAGSLLARVPDSIASALQERFGIWDFSPSTRTVLVTRPRDVLVWKC
jgi:hypothetical protein